MHIITVITSELGKLRTHKPICWIKDKWDIWLNLRPPVDSVYLRNIVAPSIVMVFGVCVILVFSVIRCFCYYFLDRILFHHSFHYDSCDYHWDFYGHSRLFKLRFRLSVTKWLWFCKCTTPWMFPPLDIFLEYWIEHVTFGPLYVMLTFPTKIFYRGFQA